MSKKIEGVYQINHIFNDHRYHEKKKSIITEIKVSFLIQINQNFQ